VSAASKPEQGVAAVAPPAQVITIVAVFLTFASGASDVTALTRLGNVFTSVMTGNMTVFGLSLARQSVSLGAHTATAVGGYIVGVAAATVIGRHRAERDSGTAAGKPGSGKPASGRQAGGEWPPRMTLTLAIELLLLAGVLTGWELSGSHPAGTAQYVILAAAACAMGLQSAAVNRMGLGNVSTTYLTGTLTGLVSSIFRPEEKVGWRRPAILAGLVAGAVLAGLLLAAAGWAVPLLPILGVTAAVFVGTSRGTSRQASRPRSTA
jgi:uncharacterized membrane protein YoaK (UPF0700 family)